MTVQNTAIQEPDTMNGLSLQGVFDTVKAIESDSGLARFQFRARNKWIDGGVNRSTIQGFYGAGREDDSREADFEFTNGEPPVLLGNNEGANPVEFLPHALAGLCDDDLRASRHSARNHHSRAVDRA